MHGYQLMQTIAELGIVFLMFSLGLEFSLPKLLAMRYLVLGVGGLQVLLTSLLFFWFGWHLGLSLAQALVEHGVTVYVVNPAQIAAYARSELSRTKTDRCDAKLIARYAMAPQVHGALRPWTPPTPGQRQLRAYAVQDLRNLD